MGIKSYVNPEGDLITYSKQGYFRRQLYQWHNYFSLADGINRVYASEKRWRWCVKNNISPLRIPKEFCFAADGTIRNKQEYFAEIMSKNHYKSIKNKEYLKYTNEGYIIGYKYMQKEIAKEDVVSFLHNEKVALFWQHIATNDNRKYIQSYHADIISETIFRVLERLDSGVYTNVFSYACKVHKYIITNIIKTHANTNKVDITTQRKLN